MQTESNLSGRGGAIVRYAYIIYQLSGDNKLNAPRDRRYRSAVALIIETISSQKYRSRDTATARARRRRWPPRARARRRPCHRARFLLLECERKIIARSTLLNSLRHSTHSHSCTRPKSKGILSRETSTNGISQTTKLNNNTKHTRQLEELYSRVFVLCWSCGRGRRGACDASLLTVADTLRGRRLPARAPAPRRLAGLRRGEAKP
ncbi:hypothetical protein EVAR_103494_1 [Eumeta japonica]|uniref:Uncharacterized protein n=1 Tax=Eumeta variegata TaxID=151549 RepID=A0A4C1ZLE4_EUMVA|nr:hypothetical protein EVAR_103494_1 [Eumeta japonica]